MISVTNATLYSIKTTQLYVKRYKIRNFEEVNLNFSAALKFDFWFKIFKKANGSNMAQLTKISQ